MRVEEAPRHAARLARLDALRVGARAVLEDALARLEAQVQAVEAPGSALRARRPRAGSAGCARSRRASRHAGVERVLAGVAEGRVAEVVRQRDRLDQVFVQPQRARDRAAELRHLERMRQPGAEQVALVVQEDLRLVDQAAERGASGRCGRGRAGTRCASAPAARDGGGRATAPGSQA